MPKKRKNRGRNKGNTGNVGFIQCSKCGKRVPRDKAKRVTRYVSLVDYQMSKELRQQGTYVPRQQVLNFYCISCSVHQHIVTVRSRDERKRKVD